jgi:hypothetical protein
MSDIQTNTTIEEGQLPPPPSEIVIPVDTLHAVETATSTTTEGIVEGVFVKGEWCTPLTHAWRDGGPILRKDGTAKKKPGRSGPRTEDDSTVSTTASEPSLEQVQTPVKTPRKQRSASPVEGEPVSTASAPPVKVAMERPTTATISRSFGKTSAAEESTETLEVRLFQTAAATVDVGYGLTLNIGNYESARVDVRVSVPCYREEMDDAYAYAKEWAEKRVQKEVADVRTLAAGKPTNNNPF